MSRVLARPMFNKKAPKRSSKGVGITSGLMDDVAGYAEGGEVMDDRTERERAARMLLERNRDENGDYQRFSETERPQMYRPAATMPMPPQPNPQQMQAMQMQQMAQMGMLPRFQEGGEVQTPSLWNRINNFLWNPPGMDRPPTLSEMRRDMGRSMGLPALTNTGISGARAMDDPNAMTPAIEQEQIPTPQYRNPMTAAQSETPQPRQFPPEGTMTRADSIGGERPVMIPTRDEARVIRSEERTSPGEPDREAARGRGLMSLPKPKAAPEDDEEQGDQGEPGSTRRAGPPPASNLSDIKAERAAKAAAARQENIWLALMQAGLAIAGGKSSNAITNIGQGGQAGLASFMALEQQRRRDEDAAMRRDLAEREYGLQQRRLAMQEPYYQAMTQRQLAAPYIAAQEAARRDQLARLNAMRLAEDAWKTYSKDNVELMGLKPEARKMKYDIFLKQKMAEFYPQEQLRLQPGVGVPRQGGAASTEPEE